jgi:death-on-curing protein
MAFKYFTVEFSLMIHDDIIQSSGGLMGIRDIGLIESVLYHLQNDVYYPDCEDKITHLLFSFNKNHCFTDGNKRSAVSLSAYFLAINDLEALVPKFILEMENIVVDVADNTVSRELLREIVASILYEEDYSEELKLKIIAAKMRQLADRNLIGF